MNERDEIFKEVTDTIVRLFNLGTFAEVEALIAQLDKLDKSAYDRGYFDARCHFDDGSC